MNTTSDWWTGPRQTRNVVGRSTLLDQIDAVIQDPDAAPKLLLLQGDGGIGKTRMLYEVRRRSGAKTDGGMPMPAPIDLYDIHNHQQEGLAASMRAALSGEHPEFRRYDRLCHELGARRASNETRNMGKLTRHMIGAFTSGLTRLARQQRIVLMLDTAERLLYAPESQLPVDLEVAEAWTWLQTQLPMWRNVVLLVAGRSQSERLPGLGAGLGPESGTGRGVEIKALKIEALSEEESVAYFRAVIANNRDAAEAGGRPEERERALLTARRLKDLGTDVWRIADIVTQGLPIWLSLVVDLLSVAGPEAIPELFKQPLDRVRRLGTEALEASRADLEAQIVERFLSTPEQGETLEALGRVPRGADAKLLGKLLDIDEVEAQRRLQAMENFSFVKVRPADSRYFLHDVMYEILRRQIYDRDDDVRESAATYEQVVEYYKSQRETMKDKLRHMVDLLLEESADAAAGSLNVEVARLNVDTNGILATLVYYRLHLDAQHGFRHYWRYRQDAIMSGETMLVLLLQAEMLSFWGEHDPKWRGFDIDGLPRSLVESSLAITPVVLAQARGEPKEVLKLAAELRKKRTAAGAPLDPVVAAELAVWEADARIILGEAPNLQLAGAILNRVIAELEAVPELAGNSWRVTSCIGTARPCWG